MNNIRGQRRWSLLTGTTDGLMMIALNGVPIGEFNVQRFSIKWIRDLGHLRCDDFHVVGQPHSKTEPTRVDAGDDGPEIPDVVRTFDHVYADTGNVYEEPDSQNMGNVYEHPDIAQNLGNVYEHPYPQNRGNANEHPNPINEGSNRDKGSGSVSDSAGVHEDSHGDNLEEGSGSVPESSDIENVEQPPASPDNFQCLKTAFENLENLHYSFDDKLYACNLGLTPENLDAPLDDLDGTPKCKRRRVENDEPDNEEFNGTPMDLMRIKIRESPPDRFNNIEFLRESARLDGKKNEVAGMTRDIVEFFPVKQLGDHSYTYYGSNCNVCLFSVLKTWLRFMR